MPVDADSHGRNPMLKDPTTERRIASHLEHARACACGPVSERLAAELAARGCRAPGRKRQGR